MNNTNYSSDLTEEQFNVYVVKYLPTVKKKVGRPKKYSDLSKFNACLYVLNNGCKWRDLPHEYPPFRVVHRYFRSISIWCRLEMVVCNLNKVLEKKLSKIHKQSIVAPDIMLIIDSKSIRSSEYFERRSYGIDGNKKIKGIKLSVAVDRLRRVWRVAGTSANTSEYRGVTRCIEATMTSKIKPKARLVIGDRYFDSEKLRKEFKQRFDLDLVSLRRNRNKLRKFQTDEDKQLEDQRQETLKKIINPWRYIVEQFFSHLEKARRLTMIYERKLSSYLGFVKLRVIQLLIKRLGN